MDIFSYLDGLTGGDKVTAKTSIQGVADVEPGVDVQAYDADLTTWGAKTAPSGTVVGTTDTQTMTNKSIVADNCLFVDGTDSTKKLQLVISGFTTGTTRTLTIPNAASITMMDLASTQTISGLKTISLNTATTSGDYLQIKPTDWGLGKPGIFVNKNAIANYWNINLYDGTNNNGTINVNATTFSWNGSQLVDVVSSQTITGAKVFSLPPRLPTYTVATVPSASTYSRGLIYVSDGTSNKRLAISDGTNWRWPDGAIVS